jgi:glycine hydroxymethyltransferase
MIPYDPRKPLDPSGIRIGTPAITTRGFDEVASEKLAHIMVRALQHPADIDLLDDLK